MLTIDGRISPGMTYSPDNESQFVLSLANEAGTSSCDAIHRNKKYFLNNNNSVKLFSTTCSVEYSQYNLLHD